MSYSPLEYKAIEWWRQKTGYKLGMSLRPSVRFIKPDGSFEDRQIFNLLTEFKEDRKKRKKSKELS